MSAPRYLTRARLRRDVPAETLRAMLEPGGESRRAATGHGLVWALFDDSPERTRDFLWREADPGVFYLLSARPPVDRRGLFRVDEPKPFAPALAVGDRLAFALRVNATVARPAGPGARGNPCDVVMNALRDVPPDERARVRRAVLPRVAHDWLARQGERGGFALPDVGTEASGGGESDDGPDDWSAPAGVRALGYRTLRVDRGRRTEPMCVGVLDLEGMLEVRDPARFVEALGRGFGRAKAFGCGLMLVRRASAGW